MRYPRLILLFLVFYHSPVIASNYKATGSSVIISPSKDSTIVQPVYLNSDAFKPATIRKLIGRRLTLKEQVSLAIFRHQLAPKKNKSDDGRDPGKTAYILGLISLVALVIPGVGLLSLPLAIIAIIKGNKVLRTDPGNRNARRGVRLGIAAILLLILIALIVAIVLLSAI